MQFLSMKRIFIFGGSGFIGSNLIEKLIIKGYTLYILLSPENKNHYLKEKVGVRIVFGKIDNIDLIKSIIENEAIDEVIHLVSNIISSSNHLEYLNELKIIIFPTLELIPFLAEKGVKFIYFSSGGAIYGDSENNKLKESDPVNPISYYGLSKLIIEEAIKTESKKTRLNFLIFRPSNPYGFNSRLNKNFGLISNCIDKILKREKIIIWGDGSIIRDYIYIDDLVEVVSNIIEAGDNNRVYNIGSGIGTSISDVLNILKNINNDFQIEYGEKRSTDVQSVILDISDIAKFKIKPFVSINNGIQKMYDIQKISYTIK